MNKNYKISIIVPIFNTEKYLNRCISSIINQTYHNIEIILIDDGSTDNSSSICEFFAQTDSRIKFLRQENKGLSSARNTGLKISSGDYISFVDSDDFIDKNTYSILATYLDKNNIDLIIFGYRRLKNDRIIYEYKDDYKILTNIDALEELFEDKTFCNYMWNKLYNKKYFKNLHFTEGRVYEDIDIQHKIFYLADKILICPYILYNYTIREDSISNSKNLNYAFDIVDIYIERFINIPYKNDKIIYYAVNSIFSSYLNFVFTSYITLQHKNLYTRNKRKFLEEKILKIMPYLRKNLKTRRLLALLLLLKNNILFDFHLMIIKFAVSTYRDFKLKFNLHFGVFKKYYRYQ